MQRLFSMFPSGRAGIALLCLRLSVIATLLLGTLSSISASQSLTWAIAILSLSLFFGFATPISASICCVAEIYLLFATASAMALCVVMSALVALALALLGPGAYSIDARLFGRKTVVFKNRRGNRSD